MAENTGIEWATHTWNPWLGCTKVSAGCKHCYAETLMDTRYGKVQWGPNGTRVKTTEAYWRKPLAWDKAAQDVLEQIGDQTRVFPSLCDVFEDWQGPIMAGGKNPVILSLDGRASNGSNRMTLDDLRRDFFALIDATPHLTWLLLTKRPENILKMWPVYEIVTGRGDYQERINFRKNVWLGCSVEDQETANARIPELLKCRDLAPVLWVSYEPALGPVNFTDIPNPGCGAFDALDGRDWDEENGIDGKSNYSRGCLDWLVVGGESGAGARPFNLHWARDAVDQCRLAKAPVFVKQMGSFAYDDFYRGGVADQRMHFKDPKGGDWDEWPGNIRVREYPTAN